MNDFNQSFYMKVLRSKYVLGVLIAVLIVAIFVYDSLSPVGVAFGFNYVLPLIIILDLNEKRLNILAPVVLTLLALIGVVLKPQFDFNHITVYNRGAMVLTIWIIAYLIISKNKYEDALRKACDETEMKVIQRTELLRQSNEMLEKLFSNTNIEIAYLDMDFNFIKVNQAYASACQHPIEFFTGKNHFDLYPHEDNESIFRETARSAKTYIAYAKAFEHPDHPEWGVSFWDWNLIPVKDGAGKVEGLLLCLTDVTSMREKELELDKQREDILHVTRVGKLAEFVSSLAHEISQPLTAIMSYAQAAQRMLGGKNPELNQVLSYIVQDDQRASEIIQRLRSLLKKTVPEMKHIDINVLINEVMVLIATDATVRNVVLKRELENGLPVVLGDRIQLQQVLLNLVSNSFDAMEKNKDSREIAIITSRKDADTLLVKVMDTGSGISSQDRGKIFTRFFTSKPDGLGMGLSISRSIIEAHGGQLAMENNPRRGATFSFTIPVHIKDAKP